MSSQPLNVHQARVRTHHTDLNAAMYHAAYFDLFDDARIETFRRLGYTYERMLTGGWTAVIRRITCDYYAAARMDDLLRVTVTIPELKRATMTIRYECCRGEELMAMAQAVFAFVDTAGKALRLPADLREVVAEHVAVLQPTD